MEIFNLISISDIMSVLVRTLIIFFFAFVILRILGRKHLSHLTYLDFLLIISLGSAVGDVMIYSESVARLFSSIIAITVVGVFVKLLDEFSSHSRKVSSLVLGSARLLVDDGKIIPDALALEDMSKDDLNGMLRLKGYESMETIKKVFIETDGEISVITYNHNNKK